MHTPSRFRVRCGLIADIQYADVDDGVDFSGLETRYFRNALNVAKSAGTYFRAQNVDFVLNLGDIVDSRIQDKQVGLQRVLENFKDLRRYDLIGNHELYCWNREELPTLLNCTEDACFYCAIRQPGWILVALDSYDISLMGRSSDHPKTIEARAILERYNPRSLEGSSNWFDGLRSDWLKYVPFNGALGADQIAWLENLLARAQRDGDTVLLFTHIPLVQPPHQSRTVLWNSDEVLTLASTYKNVLAVFSGHSHIGSHTIHEGVHHITLDAPLLCPPGEEAYALLELGEDSLGRVAKLTGVGRIPSLELRPVRTEVGVSAEDRQV